MQYLRLEDPASLRSHLRERFQVWQLLPDPAGNCGWQTVDSDDAPAPGPPVSINSAKSFFFAERENLFRFDGECFRETLPAPDPFALFGVSSCDLTAIAYQDRFFAADPYYQARRRRALLVGMDCLSPCDQGFCPSVNAGPGVDATCADLILHYSDGRDWLLVVTGEKGAAALDGLSLPVAAPGAEADRTQAIAECEARFADAGHIEAGVAALQAGEVPAALWRELGVQCLSCSGCTNLCPTCSCYDTRDLNDSDGTTRERFWDSCLFEGFQREASHHNPSAEAGSRVERFWYHKFGSAFKAAFGRYGCVGCGRCELTCPGVIGVHAVMKRISGHVRKKNVD